jgi:hypothetical protein
MYGELTVAEFAVCGNPWAKGDIGLACLQTLREAGYVGMKFRGQAPND